MDPSINQGSGNLPVTYNAGGGYYCDPTAKTGILQNTSNIRPEIKESEARTIQFTAESHYRTNDNIQRTNDNVHRSEVENLKQAFAGQKETLESKFEMVREHDRTRNEFRQEIRHQEERFSHEVARVDHKVDRIVEKLDIFSTGVNRALTAIEVKLAITK